MKSFNIASTLFKIAEAEPDRLAIALPAKPGKPLPKKGPIPYREVGFKELAHETNCISTGLLACGFKRGDRVVLMVPPGLDFFTLSFACLQAGIVPVLIDPGIGIKNLKKCIDETEPIGFIGITKAHVARIILGWGKSTIKKKITNGLRLFWGGSTLHQIKQTAQPEVPVNCLEVQPDDLAAIIFTSGSTGVPKGVMYTHGNMRQQVEMIRNTFDMRPGEIDLPTFPPFALFNPTVGISTIIPDMDPTQPADVDPERIIRVLQQYKVTGMFGSPAVIDKLGRFGVSNNKKLPDLKRVISAGAPVPAGVLRRFSAILAPNIQIFTPYGATEAMPITCIGSAQILKDKMQSRTNSGGGICIGKPVDQIRVKVIRISDEPIAVWSDALEMRTGKIGEIVVKGKNVTSAYFNRNAATKLAKIRDGDSFWHRMGDLGYKDDEGNLWCCGRKSHRVKLATKELYSVQIEGIFNKHPQVHRTALVGTGGQAVLCVETEKDVKKASHRQIRNELLAYAAGNVLTQDITTILFHPSFPVDIRHNSKIFREKLAIWARSR